ncbi:MAG: hypothetical protein RL346_1476 [Verrucomicrobiota bacterium]|jgi:cell division protein FtsZ
MIPYSRDPKQQIPATAVKIIGLGGAGSNMLERVALDNLEGAELLALSTDIRTLGASLAKDKIQLGTNLTKGLGTGGDPDLGQQAVLEAEAEIRLALKGQRIVFLCVGLGGGTGSGAAPIVTRIAREEGAFVIVFATMPFLFEGQRRRNQAEMALNQLAVLSNALVTFDNNRMGELVLAKQGIHEAFGAADKMIFESIKAVIRLVAKPGLIHVGLDELITALRATRSRCLFGSGMADGKDRASKALRNALTSPLLDQGALLRDAQSVLVHLCGGESLTLFEIELLMQALQKHVPENAQILFGAAIDSSMGDFLSVTLISSLPEESLSGSRKAEPTRALEIQTDIPISRETKATGQSPQSGPEKPTEPVTIPEEDSEPKLPLTPDATKLRPVEPPAVKAVVQPLKSHIPAPRATTTEPDPEEIRKQKPVHMEHHDLPFAEPVLPKPDPESAQNAREPQPPAPETQKPSVAQKQPVQPPSNERKLDLSGTLKLKLEPKLAGDKDQDELSFKKVPRGRFEGENPNMIDGEDLDLPPFLRKKKI